MIDDSVCGIENHWYSVGPHKIGYSDYCRKSKQLCNSLFAGSSKKIGGLRVVNVVGFKRAYGFLNEILALAKPFGTVVQHLVLDVRPEVKLVG